MATFLVNDPSDTSAGTGLTGTLRYVLGQLNAVGGASNKIDFQLGLPGAQTITLGSDLPSITKNVTIDGYKFNGPANTATVGTNASILVQLDLGGHAGLVFAAGSANSIVKGLSIDHGSAAGITIQDNGVSVVGDFIGMKADGQTPLANGIGVSVASGVTGTIIGTSALADRNLIAGNTGAGIAVAGAATIKGNLIGTDKTALAAAANGSGVSITGANSAVGGSAAGEANTIAFNTGAAVTVDTVSGIPIRENVIFQNGQGIVLLNNGNGNLVAPSSLAATSVTGLTTIEGQFTAPSAGSYTIELFASAVGDPTATQGQAHIFLGQTTLNFAGSGTQSFRATSGIQVAPGQVVTATVTSTSVGTSTFATAVGLSPAYTVTTNADSGIGSLRQAILDFQAAPSGTSKIDFNIPGTGIHTITLASALPSITRTVSIDGTTEPGFTTTPVIRLDGNGVVTDGLTLSGSSAQAAQILSLDVVHFTGAGIRVLSGKNLIQNNIIGADPTGGAAGPGNLLGVVFVGSGNTLTGNTIAFNTNAAVTVDTGTSDTISRNVIFQNGQGIALANNGNNLLAAPNALAVTSIPGLTTIEGRFNALSAGNYTLEFFASAAGDLTATPGQAHVFLGQTVVAFAAGSQAFQATSAIQVPAGQVVTATVTSTAGDTSTFASPTGLTDPFVVTTTADNGIGSLREAITNADQNSDGNTISFAIPTSDPNYIASANTWTIKPLTALPAISAPVTIDGTTPPQFFGVPVIQLDGSGLSGTHDGLNLASGSNGSRVRSLAIYRFSGAGIHVQSNNNAIQGTDLGTDASGVLAGGGNQTGLWIDNGANNIVGGLSGLGNLISGNTRDGVLLQGDGSTASQLLGNKIGTDVSGSSGLANGRDGVRVVTTTVGLVVNDTIGGTANGAGNTIAFNVGAALTVDSAAGVAAARNSVFRNGQGIVLANSGNQGLPAPNLTTVNSAGGNTQIIGQLVGAPSSTSYTIEFFASALSDPATGVQARTFLGTTTVPIGSTVISVTLPVSLVAGQIVVATATANTSPIETSSFSNPVTIVNPFQVTNTADSGLGSLRQAIINANASTGTDTITFAIGGTGPFAIALASALPAITDTVVLDGTTQAGFSGTPVIILSGAGLSGSPDGIVLGAGSSASTLKGLTVKGFAGAGLRIQSSNDAIQGNVIGVNGSPNGQGIVVTGSNDTIGGTGASAGNTISFNTGVGVTVSGGTSDAITQNAIYQNAGVGIVLTSGGNLGLSSPGLTSAFSSTGSTTVKGTLGGTGYGSNAGYTVEFFASTASEPTTGDQARVFLGSTVVTTDGSGNGTFNVTLPTTVALGQRVTATATSNVGNNTSTFALAVTSTDPFRVTNTLDIGVGSLRQAIINANASTGTDTITFAIAGSGPFTIALALALPAITDTVVLDGTTQAGFSGTPVVILSGAGLSGTPDGLSFSPSSSASTIRGLTIVNFAGAGLRLQSSNDVVQGNVIGAAGSPNGQGVVVTGNNNTIGGTGASASNIITSNIGAGVTVSGGTGDAVSRNSIYKNGGQGISLVSGGNALQPAPVLSLVNSVAGTTIIQGTLSGSTPNTTYTLEFFASTLADPITNDQARIFLGTASVTTNGSGQSPISVSLQVAVPIDQRVTATATSAAPVANTSAFATAATVASPFLVTNTSDSGAGSLRQAILNANENIGPDAITFAISGTAPFTIALATPLPTISGTLVLDATTQSGFAGTPIIRIDGGGQSANGLTLGSGSDGSIIRGLNIVNFAGAGIVLKSSGDLLGGNNIGTDFLGTLPGPGSLTSGIIVSGSNNNAIGGAISGSPNVIAFVTGAGVTIDAGTGNEIRQDEIFQNGGAGIVLVNGGNFNQPAPVLTLANSVSGTTTIVGTLAGSSPNTTYTLEFFASTTPASRDQAQMFLGSTTVLTNANGASAFSASLPVDVPVGQQVTATATSTAPRNDTSPFAGSVVVASPYLVTNNNASGAGSLRQAILNANAHQSYLPDIITFAISGPLIITPGLALPDISDPVIIDATTQPGFAGTPLVVLNGNNATGTGLTFGPGSSGSTVQGLKISGFTGSGIVIQSSNDFVSNNVITANVSSGVVVVSGSNNTISRDNVFENGSTNTSTAFNDIVLNPAANNNAPSPVITGVQLSAPNTLSVGLVFSFATIIPTTGLSATLEFFQNAPNGRPFLISSGNAQTVLITPNANDPTKSNSITVFLDVTGQGFTIGSQLIATATFSGGGESDAAGTSAFSNIGTAASPFLVTNPLDDGVGSLRKVLEYANRQTGPSCVMFDLPAESLVIHITSGPLPTIYKRVNIDGTSQPGYDPTKPNTTVQIDGLSARNNRLLGDGLSFGVLKDTGGNVISGADGSSVQALSIYGFSGAGIKADGLSNVNVLPAITIAGVFSGIDPTGTVAATSRGNGTGILLNNVYGAWIGLKNFNVFDTNCNPSPGSMPAAPNLISANSVINTIGTGNGIEIDNGGSNRIENSIIGTSFLSVIDPTLKTGNSGDGIFIYNSTNNLVGVGTDGTTRNIISGNQGSLDPNSINLGSGIHIAGASAIGNSLVNNYIGTDSGGQMTGASISNKLDGILIDGGASQETIGSQSPGLINIDGTIDATKRLGNLISGNLGSGIKIVGGIGFNRVYGNLIGVTADGKGVLGNGLGATIGDGVRLMNSPGNQIGGPSLAFGNVITGSGGDGVHVFGANAAGSGAGDLIQSNVIGAATGSGLTGNRQSGVYVTDSSANTIGVSNNNVFTASDMLQPGGNTISGNGQDGVTIEYTTARSGAPNWVGENVISHNGKNGVQVQGVPAPSALFDQIRHNFIGTDQIGGHVFITLSGTTNPVTQGNGLDGIRLHGVPAIVSVNVVSGNGLSGIDVERGDSSTAYDMTGTSIDGNRLGTDLTGGRTVDFLNGGGQTLPMGNVLDGVLLNNVVGVLVGSPAFNVMSGNLGRGIEVRGDQFDVFNNGQLPAGNLIVDNIIGLDASGSNAVYVDPTSHQHFNLGNLSDGIFLLNAPATTITGDTVSNNRGFGVHVVVQTSRTLAPKLFVQGNFIGTSKDGKSVVDPYAELLGNSGDGVFLDRVSQGSVFNNVISGNRANGINLLSSTDIDIYSNKIGTDVSGMLSGFGNASSGILLNRSSRNIIGNASPDANVISGNKASGIFVSGTTGIDASENIIAGDFIGTNAKGTAAIPNSVAGVILSQANNNHIGDPSSFVQTVISGNTLFGVLIANAATGNQILGTLIGTDVSGSYAIPNTSDGVMLINVAGNTIGGPDARQRNVISGNGTDGVRIFGGLLTGGNLVTNNIIGLSAHGAALLGSKGNQGDGVLVDNATPGNVIGPNNVISGNGQSGVSLFSVSGSGGTIVSGNFIGTDPTGELPEGNNGNGLSIFGSSRNDIGTTVPSADHSNSPLYAGGNVISGNALAGVQIFSPASGAKADFNRVHGALIGTDLLGVNAIPNHADGIQILNGSHNLIGGLQGVGSNFILSDANLISGNELNGIYLDVFPTRESSTDVTGGNVIDGNLIGTDRSGSQVLGAISGTPQRNGVLINNGPVTYIGYVGADLPVIKNTNAPVVARNVISGNAVAGIQFAGKTSGNVVQGNDIGLRSDGTGGNTLANPFGIYVNNPGSFRSGNLIGGTTLGSGNIIAGGATPTQTDKSKIGAVGILISGPQETRFQGGNAVLGNLIGLDRNGVPSGSQIGVLVSNSSNNVIGGAVAQAGNVISGNVVAGVDLSGLSSLTNFVIGNHVGTNFDGSNLPAAFLPESAHRDELQKIGILADNAYGNFIGLVGAGNVVSGNLNGVVIQGISTAPAAIGNSVFGNYIGISADGTKAVPNFEDGVQINGSRSNQVATNVISANGSSGVNIIGELSGSNDVYANAIGVNSAGQSAFVGNAVSPQPSPTTLTGYSVYLGGQLNGISIIGSSNNNIGVKGANLIQGNLSVGLYVTALDFNSKRYAPPANTLIQHNTITNNGIYGVLFFNSPQNKLATARGTANFVSGNATNFLNFLSGINGQTTLKAPPSKLLPPPAPMTTTAKGVPAGPAFFARTNATKSVQKSNEARARVQARFPSGARTLKLKTVK